jgi:signal transduction histidine kinase
MTSENSRIRELLAENEELRLRLGEAEETLRAIRSGEADAFVLSGPVREHPDSQGVIVGAAKTGCDIGERKHAESELKESEERYRRISQQFNALLDNLPDGIAQIAPDFGVLWASRAIKELVRGNVADAEGSCCYQAFWGMRAPCGPCPVARSFKSGKIEEGNIKLADGRLLELRAVPISDDSGKVESVIEVIRDITEHRKLEAQLRHAQKMESIGTLAGGIAHDFNNIITAIVGFGYITLKKMGQDDPLRQYIEHMLEGADRAAQLTKDILIFSRKQVCEKRPVDLNEIVGKVEKFLARVIGEDISCIMTLQSEPVIVDADTHQLEQVLMNLATNARDAMAGGGNLTISIEPIEIEKEFITIHGYGKPGSYALLTISDTGQGMDEETRAKIFEPFYTTKGVGKGTGLGLAVVYGIIKQHDGYINVYSEPGAGTTFRIYLPLIPAELHKSEIAQGEEILAWGTETILLAEDDESVRGLISMVLKQHGYTVIEAVNGADAVNRFMENRETIHLFVSDLIMPKMNGNEAYEEMRLWRPGLKAIFASGYAPDFIRQKLSIESGVTLISKPISPHLLLKEVRKVLEEGEGEERRLSPQHA